MIKRALLTLFTFVVFTAVGNTADWNLDAVHSSVSFSVRHLVVSKVKGNFDKFSGTASFEEGKLADGSVEFTVDVTTIDTDNEKRDEHLKSADFFDAEKFPSMTFKSTKVTNVVDNKFKLEGDLTIKDVTKPVVFECEFNGTVVDPWGNTKAGFSAETTINRQDFNITWSKAIETGGLVVSDEVEIEIDTEWTMAKPEEAKN